MSKLPGRNTARTQSSKEHEETPVPFQLFEANSFPRREEAAGRYGQRVFGRISWNGTRAPPAPSGRAVAPAFRPVPLAKREPSQHLTNNSPGSITVLGARCVWGRPRKRCCEIDYLFCWGDVFLRLQPPGLTTWGTSIAKTIQKIQRFSERPEKLPT